MRGGRGEGRAQVRRGRAGVGAGPGPRVVARRAGRESLPGPLARALVRRLRPARAQRAAGRGAAAVAQRGAGGAPRRAHQAPEVSLLRGGAARAQAAPAARRLGCLCVNPPPAVQASLPRQRSIPNLLYTCYSCQINPTQRHSLT